MDSGFGEIWPPSVVAVLDFLETLTLALALPLTPTPNPNPNPNLNPNPHLKP